MVDESGLVKAFQGWYEMLNGVGIGARGRQSQSRAGLDTDGDPDTDTEKSFVFSSFVQEARPMQMRQFRYNSDNLGYLVWSGDRALAVDGGAVEAIAGFARDNGLKLVAVTNTHGHSDHTMGTAQLARQTGAKTLDPAWVAGQQTLDLGHERIRIYPTPGHTTDSLCFHAGHFLLTGDTLFNGTVGNCFSGDLEGFYRSIRQLMDLPPETIIYAGHDYVHQSMAFARWLEPDNPHIAAYLAAYDPAHVCSRLAEELFVNPYLRFNQPEMIAVLRQKGFETATELGRWLSLMGME